jgi:hypothetical protein
MNYFDAEGIIVVPSISAWNTHPCHLPFSWSSKVSASISYYSSGFNVLSRQVYLNLLANYLIYLGQTLLDFKQTATSTFSLFMYSIQQSS